MRILLLMSFIVLAAPARAELEVLLENDQAALYVDMARIHKVGAVRMYWMLRDNKTARARSNDEQSAWYLMEVDCKRRREREVYRISLAGNMGRGEILSSGPELRKEAPWRTPASLEGAQNQKRVESALREMCTPKKKD